MQDHLVYFGLYKENLDGNMTSTCW